MVDTLFRTAVVWIKSLAALTTIQCCFSFSLRNESGWMRHLAVLIDIFGYTKYIHSNISVHDISSVWTHIFFIPTCPQILAHLWQLDQMLFFIVNLEFSYSSLLINPTIFLGIIKQKISVPSLLWLGDYLRLCIECPQKRLMYFPKQII
jgi:hypothetical protein